MTDHTTHDLAIARAERDAWQSTCEELHRAIAGANVEIEAHLGRCEAADQRARSFEAALTAEREASKGMRASAYENRGALVDVADDLHVDTIDVSSTDVATRCGVAIANLRFELAAIRDLVAPGNPQGAVVDAVRAMIARWSADLRDLHAAIARAEKSEAEIAGALSGLAERLPVTPPTLAAAVDAVREAWDADRSAGARSAAETTTALVTADRELAKLRAELAELTATRDRLLAREHEDGRLHAQLRAEVAELRARPVLTVKALDEAMAMGAGAGAHVMAKLGAVTLPAQDRAEELARLIAVEPIRTGEWKALVERVRSALASLGAPATTPTAAPGPVAAVSVEELAKLRVELAELRAPKKHPSAPDRCPKCEWTNVGLVNFGAPGAPLWLCHGCAARTIAELRARPVLTEDLLRGALDAHGYAALTRKLFAHLGPVTLPSPDRAEELTAAIYGAVERAERAMTPGPWAAKIYTTHVAGTSQETQWHEAIAGGPSSGTVVCETEWSVFEDESAIGAANIRGIVALRNAAPALIAEVRALRAAAEEREAELMAKAAPAREVAPTLVAVSDEELATAYSVAHDQPIPRMAPLRDRTIAGIRAVRAKLGAAEVTEERVKAALCEHFKYEGHRDWSADARAILAYLRATAAKGG